ncbi:heparinase II/III family protein [Bacteroides sp. OttesenSCG-928-D19]|nr:heparinase II/III family protein [Bacteroides sp. OttesenSCG-928-D19]
MKLTKITLIFFILLIACDGFAQYPIVRTGRPRMYADQDRIDWLKANYQIDGAFKADYDEFMYSYDRNWLTRPDLYLAGNDPGQWTWDWDSYSAHNQILFTVFTYRITGDPLALERCKFLAQQVITAVDEANFSSMEYYTKETFLREISETGGFILDWCYDDLPVALRSDLVQAMYTQASEFMDTYILSDRGTSYVASHNIFNTIICNQNTLVLYHASELTPVQQNTVESWYRTIYDKLVNEIIPCWTYYRDDDGGWNWGAAYSMWAFVDQFQLFENMKIATGTNFFTSLPWMRNSINQYIYLFQPDNKTIHWGDGVMQFGSADKVLYLHAKYFNDPRSRWLEQYASLPENLNGLGDVLEKMLYKDYTLPAVTQPVNPLDWQADKVGLSVSRSSWNDDATMITFFNSPSKKANHEHFDNNSFTVYKHTPLLLDAGDYDSYGSSHYKNYYERTIAHNSICVYDGSENEHPEYSNDGGQMDCDELQNYNDIFHPAHQRGKWIQYATGDGYTYNVADAQLSYNPDKLDFFRRRLLYIKPEKIIVLDHVHLNNTTTKQRDIKWIAHFANRPDISGAITHTEVANHIITYNGTDYTAANGNGNIALRTLIPANSNTTLIGGSGYEYWVDGKNYPPDPAPDMSFYTPGSWRIEVRPDAVPADGNVVYLHTIDVGDHTAPAKAGGIAFQNTISVGTDWEDVLYFFAADGGVDKDYHIFNDVEGGRTVSIYAADLVPDQYSVKIDGTMVTMLNTDANGVLQTSVQISSGSHTVEITKDCSTIPLQATGTTTIIPDGNTTTYTAVAGMNDYLWDIQPSGSYTKVQKHNNELLVTWSTTYVGEAGISYKIQNDCGWSSTFSPILTVTLLPAAPTIVDASPSGGESTVVTAPDYTNAIGYSWQINPANAGTVAIQTNPATITWSLAFSGKAEISYSVTNATGHTYPSDATSIQVNDATSIPALPTAESFLVFPNPVKKGQSLTVRTGAEASTSGFEINIYDLNGTLQKQYHTTQTEINIPAPDKTGFYLLQLKTKRNGATQHATIVVQ